MHIFNCDYICTTWPYQIKGGFTLIPFIPFYLKLITELQFIIICLPLRETYIVFPSVYVRPSVRLSVTLCLSEPYLQEFKNLQKNSKNNIPTEVVQQKIKIQFCQTFW